MAVEVGRGRGVLEFEYFQQSAWQEGGLADTTVIVLLTTPCRRPLNLLPPTPLLSCLPLRGCPGKTREGQNS